MEDSFEEFEEEMFYYSSGNGRYNPIGDSKRNCSVLNQLESNGGRGWSETELFRFRAPRKSELIAKMERNPK